MAEHPYGRLTPDTLIPVGVLVNVHATRGELRMLPFNPDSDAVRAGETVLLRRGGGDEERHVRGVRRHKRFLLLTLEGCTSMNAAAALIGAEVCVRAAALPTPGPNEIYHYELVGMTVLTTAGVRLGVVTEVLTTASNDVCIVRGGEREHLIPLIADVVREVDREGRRLVIEPLPGLLET